MHTYSYKLEVLILLLYFICWEDINSKHKIEKCPPSKIIWAVIVRVGAEKIAYKYWPIGANQAVTASIGNQKRGIAEQGFAFCRYAEILNLKSRFNTVQINIAYRFHDNI